MQNPFNRALAQTSVGPALEKEQSVGNIAAQFIAARKAKKSGNSIEHAKQVMLLEQALQLEKIENAKKSLQEAHRNQMKEQELVSKLDSKLAIEKMQEEIIGYLDAGDHQKALNRMALLKDKNPVAYQWIATHGDPALRAALVGADPSIQQQRELKGDRQYYDDLTPQQVVRGKNVFGQALNPFERAIQANRAGANVDENQAARVDLGLLADANTIEANKPDPVEPQDRPKEQLLSQYFMQNFGNFGFNEAEAFQVNKQILLGGLNELDLIEEIDSLPKPDSMSEDEWLKWKNQRKAEIFGASGPSAERKTNAAEFERMVRKYPPGGAMSNALQAINLSFGPTQAHQLTVLLDNLVGGVAWDNQTEAQKDNVAESMKRQADADPPGGESGVRVLETRKEFLSELPVIVNLMRDYEAKHGQGSLGNSLRLTDKGTRIITTRSGDADLEKIRATLQEITSNALLFKSGAAVTEQEFQRQIDVSPNIGVGFDFSLARTEALLEAAERGLTRFYTDSLGDEIGGRIVTKYITPIVQGIRDIRTETDFFKGLSDDDRKVIDNLNPAEKAFVNDAIEQGYTQKQVLDLLKKKRVTNAE